MAGDVVEVRRERLSLTLGPGGEEARRRGLGRGDVEYDGRDTGRWDAPLAGDLETQGCGGPKLRPGPGVEDARRGDRVVAPARRAGVGPIPAGDVGDHVR